MRVITKDMKHTMGVYGIRQISTGLFYYIGSSKHVWRRWLEHRNHKLDDKSSKEYKEFHELIQSNLDDFEAVLLDELVDFIHIDDRKRLHRRLVEREKMYIRKYTELGHPLVTTEENQDRTFKRSNETILKMIKSHEKYKGHAPWNKGKTGVYSEETLAKMIAAHKGKKYNKKTYK